MKRFILFLLLLFINAFQLSAQTTLGKGDIMVIGVNTDNKNNTCSNNNTSADYDNIYLVAFKDITNGTIIELTDNRFIDNNLFSSNEGYVKYQRSGGTIPSGTIFKLDINQSNNNNNIPNDWNLIQRFGNNFALNVDSDQFFIIQNGNWSSGNYTGTNAEILFGYNSKKVWYNNANNATNSRLPGTHSGSNSRFDIKSYHFTPRDNNQKYRFYDGPTTATSKDEWFIRIINPNNWKSFANCSEFISHANQTKFQKLEIIQQLDEFEVCQDDDLQIEIEYDTDNPTNSIQTKYEWFRTTTATNNGGNLIGNERELNYTEINVGTYYYYCRITYKLEWKNNNERDISYNTIPSGYYKVTVKENKTSPILCIGCP